MPVRSVKEYIHVIWDWNGTLLNDVDIAVDAMNSLLKRRNMPLLGIERYKDIVTFPIKDYYARLGFDFLAEPFEKLAAEYISEFNSEKYEFKLHNGVEEVLCSIFESGIKQSILSASHEQELNYAVSRLEIGRYFMRLAGLNDHLAMGKVERGKKLIEDLELKPHDVLLVGDTIHDYEVSRELGCSCLLVSNGHQSYERLAATGIDIIGSVKEIAVG